MDVLAEHPSELVRDQYLMQVADRLRIDLNTLRARVAELAKSPRERGLREVANQPTPTRAQPRSPLPRPGLEALRLYVHGPEAMKERLIAPYFVNEVQREIFEALCTKQSLSELIDALDLRGQDEAAQVLSELAVQELDRHYGQSDVTAVVAQLMRSAVIAELKSLDRDMREGRVTPEVALATSRDVKVRVELLETTDGDVAERDLRHWLLERASLTSS
jgi:hypothetical protein